MSKSLRKCVWNGLRVTLNEPMRCGCERDRRLLHPRIHWEFQDCLQDNNYCRKRDSELTIDRDERKKKDARIDIEDVKKILKETNSMIAVVEQASGKGRGAAQDRSRTPRPTRASGTAGEEPPRDNAVKAIDFMLAWPSQDDTDHPQNKEQVRCLSQFLKSRAARTHRPNA